jgi:hypothetical protein
MRLLQEGAWFAGWWWRLERRQGHTLATTGLFILLLLLVGGLAARKGLFEASTLRFLFWIGYLFSLLQALPRAMLDRRAEEWRWLYGLVSLPGALIGLWLFAFSLTELLGLLLWAGSWIFWGVSPSFTLVLSGGPSLGLPLFFTAFLTARAGSSYAVATVLAFPLTLFPLLWVLFRDPPLLLPLFLVAGVQSALFFFLGPYVWRG